MRKKSLLLAGLALGATAIVPTAQQWACGCAPTPVEKLLGKDQGEARAVLMIHKGKVAFKHLAPGYSDRTRFISWSMAKSVTAVLVGELVADGKLTLDAPVPFAEWKSAGDPRGAITLRQMLHMSSGLNHSEGLDPKDGPNGARISDTVATLFVDGTASMAATGLAKRLEAKPGSKFEYSSITSLLLAELITRQLTTSNDPRVRAQAYRNFAEERLFKPAGIKDAVMDFDGSGTQIGGSIIYMPLDDWGRFGQLMLAGKDSAGNQVIRPDWMTFLHTPSKNDGNYGGHFWLNRPGPKGINTSLFPGKGPDTIFAAIGHLGQWVIISPDQDLVLVRLGKTNDGDLAPVRAALGNVVASVE